MASIGENEPLAESVRFNFKYWWSKIGALKGKGYGDRAPLFLKALKNLPGSYKLWYHFLKESIDHSKGRCIVSPVYATVNGYFEHCLTFLHKMPRIWIMYLDFLYEQRMYNKFRVSLDKCFTSLPITQHAKVWEPIADKVKSIKNGKVGKHILQRYLQLNPGFIEDYLEYLYSIEDWKSASNSLLNIINDEGFVSQKGKTTYEFCMDVCKMVSTYPEICTDIDGASVIRHCINRYTDEVGNLWNFLAEFYIRQGLFEKGRDIFEEALERVSSARDFGLIYSAYMKFEEELLSLAMEEGEEDDEVQERHKQEDDEVKFIDDLLKIEEKDRVNLADYRVSKEELCIKRVESLLERREMLLNSCMLRQTPNSIELWVKRLDLLEVDSQAQLRTFHECLASVDPFKVDGQLSTIWTRFAGYYETREDLNLANQVYWKAACSRLKSTEEYVTIWCSWIEMLLKFGAYDDARSLIQHPLTHTLSDSKHNLVMSNKLWSLALDLELNFGTRESIRNCYQRMIDLSIVTPLNILNFSYYLAYEECFRVLERGLNLFKWPALHAIWINYLNLIINRYKDKKIERVRDLFERVLDECPDDKKFIYYSMYSEFEEQYGLFNHSVEILDRMSDEVPEEDKQKSYEIFATRVANFMGITRTRPIYEKALENFKGKTFILFGMRYASMERKLGEVDRARQIYNYVGPVVDPEMDENQFWKVEGFNKTWEDFEMAVGNEDTYKEMMRVRRTVESKFSILPATLEKVKQKLEEEENLNNEIKQVEVKYSDEIAKGMAEEQVA